MIRCLAGVWWGAHPFSLKLVYNALIRSVMDYGSFLLEPCRAVALKKLDIIQSKALRIMSGAMKSSPLNALQIECAEPPLFIRRQFLSDRFFFRILQFQNHPLFHKLLTLVDIISSCPYWKHKSKPCLANSFEKFKSLEAPTHRSKYFAPFNTNYEALILSPVVCLNLGIDKDNYNANAIFNSVVDDKWEEWHHIYCDASKHGAEGIVGIGVFHREYNVVQKIKMPPETSTFTGECLGIVKALDYILLVKLQKSLVISDSMSALQAVERSPLKSNSHMPIIIEIRDKLHKCYLKGYSITFLWVPSHRGIKGNEKADLLANEAVECGDLHPYINYCHDLATLPRRYLQDSWNRNWRQTSERKAKYYFSLQSEIQLKPWFAKINIGKMATSTLIRLRLGHISSPAHLAKLKVVSDPTCECGYPFADENHILLSCPLHDRSSFFETLISLEIQFPINISFFLLAKSHRCIKLWLILWF